MSVREIPFSYERKRTMVDPKLAASYVLDAHGPLATMKLQKILYYAHAYSLVHNRRPLFEEGFVARAGGPVIESLFQDQRTFFVISPFDRPLDKTAVIDADDKKCLDTSLDAFGDVSWNGNRMSLLVIEEAPFKKLHAKVNGYDIVDVIYDRANPPESLPMSDEDIAEYYDFYRGDKNPLFKERARL